MLGYIASRMGRILAPIFNIPDLEPLLVFLAVFDTIGVFAVLHVRLFPCKATQGRATPLAIFILFALIGAKCGRGLGIPLVIFIAICNALISGTIAVIAIDILDQWYQRRKLRTYQSVAPELRPAGFLCFEHPPAATR